MQVKYDNGYVSVYGGNRFRYKLFLIDTVVVLSIGFAVLVSQPVNFEEIRLIRE